METKDVIVSQFAGDDLNEIVSLLWKQHLTPASNQTFVLAPLADRSIIK